MNSNGKKQPWYRRPWYRSVVIFLWITLGIAVYSRFFEVGGPAKETVAVPAAPQSSPVVERGYRIAYDVIGCQDYEIHDKRMQYAADRDKKAFSELSALGLATGQCANLKKGEKIHIAEGGFLSKKVRRAGQQEAYWVVTEAVEIVANGN